MGIKGMIDSLDHVANEGVTRSALFIKVTSWVARIADVITGVPYPRQGFVTSVPLLSNFEGKSDGT